MIINGYLMIMTLLDNIHKYGYIIENIDNDKNVIKILKFISDIRNSDIQYELVSKRVVEEY